MPPKRPKYGGAPPRLDPDSILRAVVFVQAAARRFLAEGEPADEAGRRPQTVPPPVAVALATCYWRRRQPSLREVEDEAMGVVSIVCAREQLTLTPILAAYERYAPQLPDRHHPILEMLKERFSEVVVDADEDLLRRLQGARLPSEGRRCLEEARAYWGVPEKLPPGWEYEIFTGTEAAVERLRSEAQALLASWLPLCKTKGGVDALHAAVELELGESHSPLMTRVRVARENYREYLQLQVQTSFGWPPVGPLRLLASAGRWFAHELGEDHPLVDDFNAAVKRLLRKAERSALQELRPLLGNLAEVRRKLNTVPPPPRLMEEELLMVEKERLAVATEALSRRRQELGTESAMVFRIARGMLKPGPFVAKLAEEIEEACVVLRVPAPPPCPGPSPEEGEERVAAAVKLFQLLAALQEDRPDIVAALRSEFRADLEMARPLAALLVDEEGVHEEEGWHRPPGFAAVQQPMSTLRELGVADPLPPLVKGAATRGLPVDAESPELVTVEVLEANPDLDLDL